MNGMVQYDDRLYFELPEDFYTLTNTEEDGTQSFFITAGKTTNEKGEEQYRFNASISKDDQGSVQNDEPDSGSSYEFRINGRFPASAKCTHSELQILTRKIYLFDVLIQFSHNDAGYVINSRRAAGDKDAEQDELLKEWIQFLNTILSSAVIDGEKGEFEAFLMKDLLAISKDTAEVVAEESGMPYAKPAEGQHTHLDFLNKAKGGLSLLGNLIQVNQSGTEFSLQSVSEMESDRTEVDELYAAVSTADQGSFELAETAGEMAKLFRVTLEFFDAGHDREQEIYAGMIQRVSVYNSFRSFAWTLEAYCEKEKKRPEELSFTEISRIVDYIGKRDGLNYIGNSFSPVICSGDDIHVFYLPDSVSEEIKEKLKKETETETRSLDGLRRELEYMYPAIKKIYDSLSVSRDPETPLTGPEADILYAWCSITYAAVQAIYSEDGPVNCWWEHPEEELNRKKQRILQEIELEDKWIRENEKYLTRDERIVIRDKAFVFSGVEHDENWERINTRFTEMGGIYRSAVSGKTDYLVCDPPRAGESKLRNALEQKEKGKNVKIILLGDFLKALGLNIPTRRELLKELESDAVKGNNKSVDVQGKKDEVSTSELPEVFTYDQGLKAHGDGYEMDIPDGFVIKEGVEGRHFAAYIPNDQSPDDYRESRFFILAGKRQDYDAVKNIATIAEYVALGKGITVGTAGFFKSNVFRPYKRHDLPGDIIYGFEEGCVFVNAIFGVDDHMQMMRMQMNDVDTSASAGYMKLVEGLFDHMRADKPVELLDAPDAPAYLNMDIDSDVPDQWMTNIDDHINHLTIARNLSQTFLVEGYKKDQASGNADLQKLKKNLKDMLRDISGCADEVLEKAEKVISLKASEYPDNEKLFSMCEKVLNLADFADQYVNLGEQEIRADSNLAKEVRKKLQPIEEAKRAAEEKAKREAEEKAKIEAEKRRQREKESAEKKAVVERARREREQEEQRRKKEEEDRLHEEVLKNVTRDRNRSRLAMNMIACSMYHVVAVKPDGTVIAAGKNDHKQCDVSGWRNIVAVDCDENGTIGLTRDGHVKYTGWNVHKESGCTSWSDIKQIAMSSSCVFGLKKDGTVVATPAKAHPNSTAPDVTTWRDIQEIRRMGSCVVGIDSRGKVISLVRNYYGGTENARCHVNEGAIDAAVGDYDTVIYQKKDGTCFCFAPDTYKPQEIVKIYLLSLQPLALLTDGKVLLAPSSYQKGVFEKFAREHSSEKVIAVSGSLYKCAFLTEEGRVYIVGDRTMASGEVEPGEPFGKGFQLFDSFEKMMMEKETAIERKAAKSAEEEARKKEEAIRRSEYRSKGVCQYCGGTFKKGFLSTKCILCGRKKDY